MLKSKINRFYEQHQCQRISQGDILRDFDFIIVDGDGAQFEVVFEYVVVISQDCDLEQGVKLFDKEDDGSGIKKFNQYLPNIMIIPAFKAEILREGTHLKELFNIQTDRINSKEWKNITNYNNPRYHFLPSYKDFQVPELVTDFKTYYTLSFGYMALHYQQYYLATINELFREQLSQRFAFYLNRIGTPELI